MWCSVLLTRMAARGLWSDVSAHTRCTLYSLFIGMAGIAGDDYGRNYMRRLLRMLISARCAQKKRDL